jgi:Zn-dependent protease
VLVSDRAPGTLAPFLEFTGYIAVALAYRRPRYNLPFGVRRSIFRSTPRLPQAHPSATDRASVRSSGASVRNTAHIRPQHLAPPSATPRFSVGSTRASVRNTSLLRPQHPATRRVNTSLRLGSLLGITIRVHVLLLGLVALMLIQTDGLAAFGGMIAILFATVLLHELGHSIVAQSFGIRVLDITLWPLGGMARMSEIPESGKIEGLIAIAGPIVNFVLAAIAAPFMHVSALSSGEGATTAGLAFWFFAINITMGLFNLLPAFPMDGGRILRAVLGRNGDWVVATETAVQVGRFFAALLALAGLFALLVLPGMGAQGVVLLLVAAFVWITGTQELSSVRLRHGIGPFATFHAFAQRAAPWDRSRTPGIDDGDARPQTQDEAQGVRGFSDDEIADLEQFRGPLRSYRADEH